MANQEQLNVIQFRRLFETFSKRIQKREISRLKRVVEGKPPIIATKVGTEESYQFNTVGDLMKWLKTKGYPNASNSNVYKSLRNVRPSAYGYVIKYKGADDQT